MYNKKKSPVKFMSAGIAALSATNRTGVNQVNPLAQEQIQNSFSGGGMAGILNAAKAAKAAQQVTSAPAMGAMPSMGDTQGIAAMGSAPSTGIVGAAAKVSQAAQAAQSAVNAGATMGVGNPLSGNGGPAGSSNPFGGQKFEITPVQMTYDTPIPGNEMGNANPLFNDSVTSAGNTIFGDVGQRQRSLQNQAGDIQAKQYVKDPSVLQGNAFGLDMEQTGGDYDKAKEIIKNK